MSSLVAPFLVALSSGSAAETRTCSEPRYRRLLADVVYTGVLDGAAPLNSARAVWVPEGTPRRRVAAVAPSLEVVLERGGAVLLFGEHQAGWPISVRWTYRAAGGAGKTTLETDAHGFAASLGAAATDLHHHGVLDPPPGAEVLLAAPDGAAVAYLDQRSTPGTLFVTTVDPLAHFGTTGAADAARFLDAFLPWVVHTLLPGGDPP